MRMYLRLCSPHTHTHIRGKVAGIFHITMATTNFWPKASVKGSQQGVQGREEIVLVGRVTEDMPRKHLESRKLAVFLLFSFYNNICSTANLRSNPKSKFHAIMVSSIDYTLDSGYDFDCDYVFVFVFYSYSAAQVAKVECCWPQRENQFVAEVETDCELGKVEHMQEIENHDKLSRVTGVCTNRVKNWVSTWVILL